MCEIIIDGKMVWFDGSVLTEDNLRRYQSAARHIEIGKSVTEIESYAFYHFFDLESIEIPDSVREIKDYAFCGCEAIERVVIPNSVTKIGAGAFNSCKSLKSIEIPKSVTYIGRLAFFNCNNVRINTKGSKYILASEALSGIGGQIITIDISGDVYPVLTYDNKLCNEGVKLMVITGHVDCAKGRLYSGYEFNGVLDPQNKEFLYCYGGEDYLLYDATMDGLKAKLKRADIR